MRIDRQTAQVTTYYAQEDYLRTDRSLHPVLPRYVEYERADNNEEKTDQNEPLKNQTVRQYIPGGMPEQRDQSPEVTGVVVTLSNPDAVKDMMPPDLFPSYEFSNGVFQSTDQFYTMVRKAYSSLNKKPYKGQHVDRYV